MPTIGFQYTGLTNFSNSSKPASDFKAPIPTFAEYLGLEILYSPKKSGLIHKLNFQRNVFGFTARISSFEKLGLYGQNYKSYDATEQLLLSYHAQLNSNSYMRVLKRFFIKLNYSIGVGIGFNRSKAYYEEQFKNDYFYNEYSFLGVPGFKFLGYSRSYTRKGIGYFIMPEIGVSFYNKYKRSKICVSVFYDIGLKQQIESNGKYFYGNSIDPSKYVERNQKISTRGSVFGLKIGVPIKIYERKK